MSTLVNFNPSKFGKAESARIEYIANNELRHGLQPEGLQHRANVDIYKAAVVNGSNSFRMTEPAAQHLATLEAQMQNPSFYDVAYLERIVAKVSADVANIEIKSRKSDLVFSENTGAYDHAMYEAGFDDCFQTIEELPCKPIVTLVNYSAAMTAGYSRPEIAKQTLASVVVAQKLADAGYSVRILNSYPCQNVDISADAPPYTCLLMEVQASEQSFDLATSAYYISDSRFFRTFTFAHLIQTTDAAGGHVGYGLGTSVKGAEAYALTRGACEAYGIVATAFVAPCDTDADVTKEARRILTEITQHA